MKVVLRGYYGFGNLGDDILLRSVYSVVNRIFTDAEIFIFSESSDAAYLIKILGKPVPLINHQTNIEVDWVIHGGGGTYFDFNEGTKIDHFKNSMIRLMGYSVYRNLMLRLRTILGKNVIKTKFRVGLGIGVGTFTKSSPKFSSSILSLSDFSQLYVRDAQSLDNLLLFNFNYDKFLLTDLAFNTTSWLPENTIQRKRSNQFTVGFILRDWIYDQNFHVFRMIRLAEVLLSNGYKVQFFSFDKNADTQYIHTIVNSGFEIIVWDPLCASLNEFLNELSGCNFVISSRAHGAILSACLHIPGCCLNIEPKLEAVVSMMPRSYSLVSSPYDETFILNMVEQESVNSSETAVIHDVRKNIEKLEAGLSQFIEFAKQHS